MLIEENEGIRASGKGRCFLQNPLSKALEKLKFLTLFNSKSYVSVHYRCQRLLPLHRPRALVRPPWPRWPAPSGGGIPAADPSAAAPPAWPPAADGRTMCSCSWLSAPRS